MCPINWRDILSISVTQRRNAHFCHHHRQLSNYVTGSQVTSFAIPPFCVVFWKNGLRSFLKPTPLQPPNGIWTSKPTNTLLCLVIGRCDNLVNLPGVKIETSHWKTEVPRRNANFVQAKRVYSNSIDDYYRLILMRHIRVCNMWWGISAVYSTHNSSRQHALNSSSKKF